MEYPLTSQEVMLIRKASSLLNKVYSDAFATLATLTRDGGIRNPRVELASLETSRDSLAEIRRDVGERPVLTDEHITEILILKDSLGTELLGVRERNITPRALAAMEAGTFSEEEAEGARHTGLGRQSHMLDELNRLYELAEQKMTGQSAGNSGMTP